MEVLLEDDVFFADLNRQISLLIMDDDEDPTLHSSSVSLQGFPHQAIQHPIHPAFFHPEMRRGIKGTGVFIPQISQPRRKNRQSGKHQSKSRSRQSPSSTGVSQVTYNNNSPLPSTIGVNHMYKEIM